MMVNSKNIIIYLAARVLLSTCLFAQAPGSFNYQAVLRDVSGNIKANTNVNIRIDILQDSVTGTIKFAETFSTQTNDFGYVNLQIGNGTLVSGDLGTINWSEGPYFIKISIDGVVFGISQLLSVPYALYAKNVENMDLIFDILLDAGLNGIVKDIDDNIYKTIKIGSQVWMAENLKTTRYSNGHIIGTTTPATLNITGESNPKYQWAYNGDEENAAVYGRLYTWYAATDSRNVCPSGWHLPASAEWTILINYVGGTAVAGDKLKEIGEEHWQNNPDATDEVGFTALPGGFRYPNDYHFNNITVYAGWWCRTDDGSASDAYHVGIGGESASCTPTNKKFGNSVRCVRD